MKEFICTTSFIRFWRRSGLTEVYCNMQYSLTFFSVGFVYREVSKISVICHVSCEELYMFGVTPVDMITDSDIFINFDLDKMIFSILRLPSVVHCKRGHCLETIRF